MADSQRLEELRRRVQKDPASLVFAQLAEECRRAGDFQEAVRVCRAGLAHHPDYLSARVTLGRALLGLEHFEQAAAELAGVLRVAPENLAALRGLAEIHERRGAMVEALDLYRAAHALAPEDPEVTVAIEEIERRQQGTEPGHAIADVAASPGTVPASSARSAEDGTAGHREAVHPDGRAPDTLIRRLERFLAAIEARRATLEEVRS